MSPLAPAAAGRRMRQNLLFLLAGLPLAIAAPAAVTVCWPVAVLMVPPPRAELLLGIVLAATVLVAGAGTLTALQQRRFAGRLGVVIPSTAGTGIL